MEKFNILKGVPANLPMINVDTDMIIPKQFLKTLKRSGLGKSLFFDMRYDDQGKKIDNFVLNKEPYNKSSILLTGKNFGCGSSREHAPWALLDFGIKCIIGPSFADIFYNNCFKNSMLPIVLSQNNLEEIVEYSKRKEMVEINLTKQEIKFGNKIINFEIDPFKKECLLNGLDDIALSLEKSAKITSYEKIIRIRLTQNAFLGLTYPESVLVEDDLACLVDNSEMLPTINFNRTLNGVHLIGLPVDRAC